MGLRVRDPLGVAVYLHRFLEELHADPALLHTFQEITVRCARVFFAYNFSAW